MKVPAGEGPPPYLAAGEGAAFSPSFIMPSALPLYGGGLKGRALAQYGLAVFYAQVCVWSGQGKASFTAQQLLYGQLPPGGSQPRRNFFFFFEEKQSMQKESFVKRYGLLIGTGLAVGAAAVLLTALGNPANMGFCIACFLRDIAGALNFQRAGFDAEVGTGIVQYIRPEIIGLVLGSTAIAMVKKEFRPKGGSSPMTRFILAVFVMIGALVFLGCPLRMVIRIGGGDLNAVVGLVGFAIGILIGILFLKRGFSLRRAYQQSMAEGLVFPVLMLALLVLLVLNPLASFVLSLIPYPLGRVALIVVYVLLGIDFFGSWLAVLQLHSSLKGPNEVYKFWHKLSQRLDNAVTRRIQKRMALAYPSLEKDKLRSIAQEREKLPPFAYGIGYYKLFSLFLIGAFLGDITETVWCLLTAGRLMSRSSVVYGPFSIVWGLGCVLLTALLYRYRERSDSFIFLFGTVVGGAYEYICSVFTELVFGTIFWDYSHLPFNLAGRINLLFCFFWGIAAVVWVRVCYPKLSGLIERIPKTWGRPLTWVLVVFFLCDMTVSALALSRCEARSQGLPPQNQVEEYLDGHFGDDRLSKIYPAAVRTD